MRIVILGALCAACLAVTIGAIVLARTRPVEAAHQIPAVIVAGPDALADWRQHPFLMFSSTAPDDSYGKIGIVPLDHPDGPRYLTSLEDRSTLSSWRASRSP